MRQGTYNPAREGNPPRYQNPWWMLPLAALLAATALLGGRFMADHYVKPALPKESVLAAHLQSEEGQDLLRLASDRGTYALLLHFASGEIQAAFDEGYIPGPEDLRILLACAAQAHQQQVAVQGVQVSEEGVSLTGFASGEEAADAFLAALQTQGFQVSYLATNPGEEFGFTVFFAAPPLEETVGRLFAPHTGA